VAPPATFVPHDPYHNFVSGFSLPWVCVIYLLAQVFLGFHLYHGVWSTFQSIGWAPASVERGATDWRRTLATAFALLVVAGNASFPLSVQLGIVR
jgi:succinate dehydrogenase / fumarate reductase cytochrome b subunit